MTAVPAPLSILVDLDGVVWRAEEPVAGAATALARLVDDGHRVAYFTNNSFPTVAANLGKLAQMGVATTADLVLSSAQAAGMLGAPGERALVVGGLGIVEALEARGLVAVVCEGPGASAGFDLVVVGIDPAFDYGRLARAMTAVGAGARLVGTNADATWPTPSGELPGGGAILAAVAAASGTDPVVAGKPHEPAAQLVRSRLGAVDLMIGDRLSTDGAFARRLGARFGLVLSGVTPADHGPIDPPPAREAEDLAHLVDDLIERRFEPRRFPK
ncbi:MAG TPA: HAD hydrolase-like protein [Acidimicrobiales bacterium]|nr:HAD hydrolase-like protein [Acidimicrobiales bacterium]